MKARTIYHVQNTGNHREHMYIASDEDDALRQANEDGLIRQADRDYGHVWIMTPCGRLQQLAFIYAAQSDAEGRIAIDHDTLWLHDRQFGSTGEIDWRHQR